MSEIRFSRKPYTITYKDQQGEIQKIKRRPPPKLHEALPTDVVELTTRKNSDWQEGGEFQIKHISRLQPNTIQLVNEEGQTTFVPYYDVRLEKKVAPRGGVPIQDQPIQNRYLLWP